ncbi:hypothetical protein ACJZ2D_016446 [Fusarium nematophilum]
MPVTIETVSIPNIAWDTAADIYFPPNFDEKRKYPGVVSAHPIGSCKEQTSGNVYGKAMAETGFVVFAFDASFQGASGGEPRFVENPEFRVSDFRYVVDYIQTLQYVDPERIGVLGVCGGGGYAFNAAMTDYRLKCCVGITPVNFGRLVRESFGNFDPVGSLEKMAKQRTLEAQGADRFVMNYLPPTVAEAKKMTTDPDVLEATEYYKTDRGKAPCGATSGLFSFNSAAVAWDAFNHAEVLMTRPFIAIVGAIPGGFGAYRDAHEIHGRAGSKEKHISVLPNVSHYMLYDEPKAVKAALDQNWAFVRGSITCPYFTTEFKRDGQGEDAAVKQVAAAGAIALFNRFRLREEACKARPDLDEDSNIRHYTLTWVGPNFVFWILRPRDGDQWSGCTMTRLMGADCTDEYGVRQLVDWINRVKDSPVNDISTSRWTPEGKGGICFALSGSLEIKTDILRHLPALVYSEKASKEVGGNDSPAITSLYLNNGEFELYSEKVDRQPDASSLRLRWQELKFSIKEKYVKSFLNGNYEMDKAIRKMKRQSFTVEQMEAFKTTMRAIQDFVQQRGLSPVLRTNYFRSAFQTPADDRIRITIDTNVASLPSSRQLSDRRCTWIKES